MLESELRNKINEINIDELINIIKNEELTEQFIRDYNNVFSKNNLWSIVSKYQHLSKDLMMDFATKIDWSVIDGKELDCDFIEEIPRLKIKDKVKLKLKKDFTSFDDEQMQQIWLGIKYNENIKNNKEQIDVESYAYSHISAEKMQLLRENLIKNIQKEKSIDDVLNNNVQPNTNNQRLNNKSKSKKLMNNKYGQTKLLDNGIFEYPQKNHISYEDSDNEFGSFNIMD